MLKKGDKVICIRDNGGGVRVGDVGYYLCEQPQGSSAYKQRYFFSTMRPGLNGGDYWLGTLGLNVEPFIPDEDVYY